MKWGLLLVATIGTISFADAGEKSGPVDLTGSWKESRRISLRKERLDYTDTTFYDFMVGNEYTTQRKNSMMFRGTYKATSGTLDLGMRMYNVLELSKNRMVLKDDAGSYEFVRYNKAAANVENNSQARSTDRAYKEDLSGGAVRPGQMAGKWEVYKRTSSVTLPEIDYTRILRVIDIRPEGSAMGGRVWSAKDMENAPSWTISRYSDGTLYCSGKSNRQLRVVSCTDGELILQEDNLTYFFKQFK